MYSSTVEQSVHLVELHEMLEADADSLDRLRLRVQLRLLHHNAGARVQRADRLVQRAAARICTSIRDGRDADSGEDGAAHDWRVACKRTVISNSKRRGANSSPKSRENPNSNDQSPPFYVMWSDAMRCDVMRVQLVAARTSMLCSTVQFGYVNTLICKLV